MTDYSDGPYMTPHEAMKLLRVDRKTLSRWSDKGDLRCIRTLGGHRRYATADVRRLVVLQANNWVAVDPPTYELT